MKKVILLLLVSMFALAGCSTKETQYNSDLQDVADKMLENAAQAEEILNIYATVWSYSIESQGAIPVADMATKTGFDQDTIKEYFEINNAGNIPNDFSINIHSLNAYYEESGELGEIEKVSGEIKSKIKELNEPPKDYEKVYDEVLDMYTYSEEYIDMALNPSGSLQEFNDNRDQLTNDILSKHKRIEAIMPSID